MAEGKAFSIGRLQIGYWKHYRYYGVEKLKDGCLIGIGMFYGVWFKKRIKNV